MLEGKTHTLFLRYAVPQMVGLLFNSMYTIVDGVFIGNRLGRDAMAAAAVAVPLVEALISLALAVASGAGVIIATRLGQGEEYAARKIFSDAVWMLGIAGILIAALGNILLHPLARLLGPRPTSWARQRIISGLLSPSHRFSSSAFFWAAWSATTGGQSWQ